MVYRPNILREIRKENLAFLRTRGSSNGKWIISGKLAFQKNGLLLSTRVISEIVSAAWEEPNAGTSVFDHGAVVVDGESFSWVILFHTASDKLVSKMPTGSDQTSRVLTIF